MVVRFIMAKRLINNYFLVLLFPYLFSGCGNKITNEIESIECQPTIADLRWEWNGLNDCALLSGGPNGSLFYILVKRYGQCIDSSTPFTVNAEFINADGTTDNNLAFTTTAIVLGDQLRIGVCFRFGQATYGKITLSGTTASGKNINPLDFVIYRPAGAN